MASITKQKSGCRTIQFVGAGRRRKSIRLGKVSQRQVMLNLKNFFGADRAMESITEGDAEDFKLSLIGEKLASTTVHKRLQCTRMFFRDAKRRNIIFENPFIEVKAKAVVLKDRQRFIPREETDRMMAVCNPTWRRIVGLARYGGLRCPSRRQSHRESRIPGFGRQVCGPSWQSDSHG